MSSASSTPRPSRWSLVRRLLSMALSLVTIAASASILTLLLREPSIHLSDGAFGRTGLEAALLASQPWCLPAGIAAILLLVGLPRAGPRWRRRLPWVLAISAACSAVATVLVPLVIPVIGLLIGLIVMATGG